LYGKSEAALQDPRIKFTFGVYYKHYTYTQRYFFVPKMGAEIASGIIIGLVPHVPTQLTLLLTLQLVMFLYTTHCEPYALAFQSTCVAIAYVMKMVTYALLSSFVIAPHDVAPEVQDLVGTIALVLQVTLLLLFNSRQCYILYRQLYSLVTRAWTQYQASKQKQTFMLAKENTDTLVVASEGPDASMTAAVELTETNRASTVACI
jgi:hypothetical protein